MVFTHGAAGSWDDKHHGESEPASKILKACLGLLGIGVFSGIVYLSEINHNDAKHYPKAPAPYAQGTIKEMYLGDNRIIAVYPKADQQPLVYVCSKSSECTPEITYLASLEKKEYVKEKTAIDEAVLKMWPK